MKAEKIFSLTFIKAQCSSAIATAVDFLFTVFLTEICNSWYLFSSCIGAFAGGVTNFALGRNWVFKVQHNSKIIQARRYLIVWTGSFLLNSSGMFMFTDIFKIHYMLSKTLVVILVGVLYNFSFQKFFVFRD
jgi:putative flippase GtrA